MVDDYIRYPVVKIVSTTSAAAVTPKLNEIFALLGIREECWTDNSPPFKKMSLPCTRRHMGSGTERLLRYTQK